VGRPAEQQIKDKELVTPHQERTPRSSSRRSWWFARRPTTTRTSPRTWRARRSVWTLL